MLTIIFVNKFVCFLPNFHLLSVDLYAPFFYPLVLLGKVSFSLCITKLEEVAPSQNELNFSILGWSFFMAKEWRIFAQDLCADVLLVHLHMEKDAIDVARHVGSVDWTVNSSLVAHWRYLSTSAFLLVKTNNIFSQFLWMAKEYTSCDDMLNYNHV